MKTVEELAREWVETLRKKVGFGTIKLDYTLRSAFKDGYAQALKEGPLWIKTSERLPAESERVLGCYDDREINVWGWVPDDKWYDSEDCLRHKSYFLKHIRYWQPLPLPPKEKEDPEGNALFLNLLEDKPITKEQAAEIWAAASSYKWRGFDVWWAEYQKEQEK